MPLALKARRTFSRLRGMSWDELRTRTSQEFSKRADELRYRFGFTPAGPRLQALDGRPRSAGRFFFHPDELPPVLELWRERKPDEARAAVEEAERICRHRFDLLGYRGVDYGLEIDWHLDAVHGKRAPLKAWHKIRYLDFNEVGDHKIVWELNRHQHLVTLAKAYQLTREARFAAELLGEWRDWQQQNPYPIGINWASSLEVAFRSLSWLWIKYLLAGCPLAAAEFGRDLRRALALSGRHIERYLSTYFSANTHLLGEAVALFFIGTLESEIPAAGRWQRRGWEIVLHEARRQVRLDGLHFEQSLYYHVYALDFFLHARTLAAANGVPIPTSFDETLVKMLEILQALGQAGDPPRFGDDDGGRVFNPRRNRAEHLFDPLATGAALFRRADFKAAARGLREETLWLLGARGCAAFDELEEIERPIGSAGFEAGGVYVMADTRAGSAAPQRLVILAGSSDSGTGGHAHADALSIHLAADGRKWLTDPGTFCYVSASGKERDALRSTAAHNTLEVDYLSQADPAGPFAWANYVKPRVGRWATGETFDLFVGTQDGYRRLPNPVEHTRSVFHLKPDFWLVRDVARGEGAHRLNLRWHLAQGLVIEKPSDCVTIVHPEEGARGAGKHHGLAILSPERPGWQERLTEGQLSPAYGASVPGTVVDFQIETALPAELALLLRLCPCELRHTGGPSQQGLGRLMMIQAETSPAAVAVYRYNNPKGEYLFFFAESSQEWKFEAWASDADFLYFARSSTGSDLVLCGGSYVEFSGDELLRCRRPLERIEWLTSKGTDRFLCSDEQAFARRAKNLPGREALLSAES